MKNSSALSANTLSTSINSVDSISRCICDWMWPTVGDHRRGQRGHFPTPRNVVFVH